MTYICPSSIGLSTIWSKSYDVHMPVLHRLVYHNYEDELSRTAYLIARTASFKCRANANIAKTRRLIIRFSFEDNCWSMLLLLFANSTVN